MPDHAIKPNFKHLKENCPSGVIARTEVGKVTGGLIHPKYIANLDSQGLGPKGRIKCGRKTGYLVDPFIEWLEKRSILVG